MKCGKKLSRRFYRYMTAKVERILSPYYDDETIESIINDCAAQYDGVINRLPYIGGLRNFYTPIIIVNGWFVCTYKAMHEQGIEDDVIGYVISTATNELFDKVPGFIGRRFKGIVFSRFFRKFIRKQAEKSQKRKYPEDWLYTAEITKWGRRKEEREIKLTFDECGVHKYYEQEKCEALKKYCNFCDPQYSIRYKLGLDANHTMAQGCKECVLAFNNKRETALPDNIIQMNKKAQIHLSH